MAKQHAAPALLAVGTVFAVCASLLQWPIVPFGLCGYLLLSIAPGAALYRLVSREPGIFEGLLAGVALSPVLTTSAAALAMLAGMPTRAAAAVLVVIAGAVSVAALRRGRPLRPTVPLTRRQALALAAVLLIVAAATAYLPFSREWWRMRSDAWFHGAVFAEIRDFGIPPEDPYYVGFPLQYMWFYHVFVVALNRASGIGPFMIMALINIHALVAYGLATYALSALFRKSFSQNYGSVLTAIFGINAAFWAFIPFKLLRSFTGDVRGMEEVRRIFDLHPFDVHAVREFVTVGQNVAFFLDKFMVATALSLGLALMAVVWYGAILYTGERKIEGLIAACVAAFGVVSFHTALGVPFFGGMAGGLFLAIILGRRIGVDDVKPYAYLLVFLLASGLAATPYLYSVTHAKSGSGAVPLGISADKLVGVVVSCAFVAFAAAFQVKALGAGRTPASKLLFCAALSLLGVALAVQLPVFNNDKLSFLLFYPLAVVGGWSVADLANRAGTPRGRVFRYVLASLLAFAPLNLFQMAGYYNTAPIIHLSEDNKKIAEWIRANTPRESIILDSRPGGFLLVAGPRRYYMANDTYAEQWSYDETEIAKRRRLLKGLFTGDSLDVFTLETLGTMLYDPVLILRRNEGAADRKKFESRPELFSIPYSSGAISIIEVDRKACLEAAQRLRSEQ